MPEKPSVKGKAKHFLFNLIDSFDSKKENHSNPPNPPPKPEFYDPKTSSPFTPDQTLIPEFNKLSVSANEKPNAPISNPSFVGGFKPTYNVGLNAYHPPAGSSSSANTSSSSTPDGSNPPIAMPVPFSDRPPRQSLTMQMALQPPGAHVRPHSNPIPPSFSKPAASSSSSLPSRPPLKKPASTPSTPTKANKSSRASAVSTSSTPNGKAGQEQCAGVTKAGKRCARMVKATSALSAFDSDDEESSSVPRFCYQHSKELLGPSGYYARKNGEWVDFDTWIPPYLQSDTKVSLRVEMEKARSQSDVHGYIYTFEIRDAKEMEMIKLKVGRAVNLVKRIDQWGKQCGSKEQVLRGFYPGSVEPDEDGNEGSLMKGRVKAGEKGPWCHRLERLIHLELADLACTTIYLEAQWPNVDAPESEANGTKSSGSRDSNSAGPCADCGSIHKEIFEFKRWGRGKKDGKEWEELVKPVIERWGRFVELYV